MTENTYDAFLSYARSDDEPFVRLLHADLIQNGFKVWFDRECMPNRALTFLQEVRDAVEKSDRLIAVIGPAAVKSDYVLSEWQHAMVFAKGVVPLLRLGDFDLLPEDMAQLHCVDCRAFRPYDQTLTEVVRLLREPIPPLGPLLTLVPSLPPHFQPRRQDLERLAELVLEDVQRPTVITSARQVSAVQGMGGIGKSVLAAAFTRVAATRRACTDGVIWLTLGPQPDLIGCMSRVGTAWGEDPHHYATLETAQARLPRVLEGKVCLLVLDDVWQLVHTTLFVNALGPRCRLLITTRDASLGRALGAREYRLELLSHEASLQLLADWLSVPAKVLPLATAQVARRCGYLPLALALCGALARDGIPWRDLLEALEEADLAFLEKELKDYPYPDVYRALMVSVECLARENPVGAQHYRELAVFPPTEAVPKEPALRLWRHTNGLTDRQARKLLSSLAQKSLLLLSREAERCRMSLHDLQHAFLKALAREKKGGLSGLHNCLLAAYSRECGEDWGKGPDDDYFFQHLAHHLAEAGREDELRRLLLDFHWLWARLAATDIQGLISDYDFLPGDEALRLIQGALRLSAHVLALDKNKLAGHLNGRLLRYTSPGIQGLLTQACEIQAGVWLRPLTSSLRSPGGPLVRILTGHKGVVDVVTVLSEKAWAISASDDCTLKIWDLETGLEFKTLSGHDRPVSGVAICPKKNWAISGSNDGTLKVWDLSTGNELRTITGHSGMIFGLAMYEQRGWAISASDDRTLRVWDIETGQQVRTLAGHTDYVTGVAVYPERGWAVSTSWDRTLKVWDLETGQVLQTLRGHKGWIKSVAVYPERGWAISASDDCTLKIWDLETGQELRTLTGHSSWVTGVEVYPEKGWAISASWDRTLKVWDLETGRELRTLTGHSGGVIGLALYPQRGWVISASFDRTLRVWNLEMDQELQTPPPHTEMVYGVSVYPERGWAVSASWDQTLKVWDLKTGRELRTLFGHGNWVLGLTIYPEKRLAVSASDDKTLRVWDLETDVELCTLIGHTGWVNAVCLLPEKGLAVSASDDKTIKVWDLETGLELRTLAGHTGAVLGLALDRERNWAISASSDRTLKIWDLETGRELRTLASHTEWVRGVELDSKRGWIVSASGDRTLKVWDLETGAELRSLTGHTGWVYEVALHLEKGWAVSASDDQTVKIWDLETGTEIITFNTDGPCTTVALDPVSHTVLVGGKTGEMHFLRLEGV
jgi:WD40 repeat protein